MRAFRLCIFFRAAEAGETYWHSFSMMIQGSMTAPVLNKAGLTRMAGILTCAPDVLKAFYGLKGSRMECK